MGQSLLRRPRLWSPDPEYFETRDIHNPIAPTSDAHLISPSPSIHPSPSLSYVLRHTVQPKITGLATTHVETEVRKRLMPISITPYVIILILLYQDVGITIALASFSLQRTS